MQTSTMTSQTTTMTMPLRTTADKLPKVHVTFEAEEYERLGLMPWFTFRVNFPQRPLPSVPERPRMETARLVVRPLLPTDLEAFHALRREAATQSHSTTRGRPDRDAAESRAALARLQPPHHDQGHWYFGAFLRTTGELIGEGGLPDCEDMPRSGWPEAEVLIKPAYCRQGYGTELFQAFMGAWWDLPRQVRKHQLLPVPHKEPGDLVVDGVGFVWEETNEAARSFFAKVLGQGPVSGTGTFVDWERREGREAGLVRWQGTLSANPRA